MGKPLVSLSTHDAYRLWAATYDHDPNPLLALEERLARDVLGPIAGWKVIDLCSGTGRWICLARSLGARVVGIDLSPEMLQCAARKPACAGRVALGDVTRVPLRGGSAHLAICSFGISYAPSIRSALREMARIARRIMISDLHPAAARAGWTRSFHHASQTFSVAHRSYSLEELEAAANAAGLKQESVIEGFLGEPERKIFARAGKEHLLDEVAKIPAVFVATWTT